jgi:chromate transporter
MDKILTLVWIFIKIGAFTFGGGYAMIPMIRSELVAYGLMTFNEVGDVVGISQMTPGPFAVNAATFAGVKTAGVFGGITTTLAVMLPSFIFSVIAAKFFLKYQDNFYLKGTLAILRPAVTGLIAASAIAMIAPAVFNSESFFGVAFQNLLSGIDIPALLITVASAIAVIGFKAPPIPVILISAVAGVIIYAVL